MINNYQKSLLFFDEIVLMWWIKIKLWPICNTCLLLQGESNNEIQIGVLSSSQKNLHYIDSTIETESVLNKFYTDIIILPDYLQKCKLARNYTKVSFKSYFIRKNVCWRKIHWKSCTIAIVYSCEIVYLNYERILNLFYRMLCVCAGHGVGANFDTKLRTVIISHFNYVSNVQCCG